MRSDVGDQVSEPVDLQHNPAQPVFIHSFRLRRSEANVLLDLFAKFLRIDFFGQLRRHRSKNIARVKRIAHRLQEIMLGGDVPHVHALFPRIDQRKHAIVRAQRNDICR